MPLGAAIASGVIGTITNLLALREAKRQTKMGEEMLRKVESKRGANPYKTSVSVSDASNQAQLEAQGDSGIARTMQRSSDRLAGITTEAIKRSATSSSSAISAAQESEVARKIEADKAAVAGYEDINRKKEIARGLQTLEGQYEDKAYDLNIQQPYLMGIDQAHQLMGAGSQNKFNALAGIGMTLSSAAQLIPDADPAKMAARKEKREAKREAKRKAKEAENG